MVVLEEEKKIFEISSHGMEEGKKELKRSI